MDDFASSLIVRMIERSLRAQGIAYPAARTPEPAGPRVALARKRALIEAVLRAHGPRPLLRVGDVVGDFAATPAARLFEAARDPHDLIERWLRVERYFHARHRSRLIDRGPGFAVLQHVAIDGPPPMPGEDIVVAAVLRGLLAWLGAQGATLGFPAARGRWQPAGDAIPRHTARWRLAWQAFDRRRQPTPGAGIEVPLHTASGRELPSGLARAVYAQAAADPGARRTVRDYAADHGLSSRSFQRRLAENGWTLQKIVAAMRLQVAAELLSTSDMPIALVGLFAGYSDQPHFQRAFQKGLGPTPGLYRQLSQTADRAN
ncbi:MAG: helix-turn-helix transcriptional regulator [Reyranellaceae bacterium]